MANPRHTFALILSFILLCGYPLRAQNRYDLSQFTHETREFFARPAHWKGNDWLKLGIITGGTVCAMSIDRPVRDAVLRNGGPIDHTVPIDLGRGWGSWYLPVVVVSGFGLHGQLTHTTSSRKIAFEAAQAVLYAETTTQLLKIAFGRARPYEDRGAFTYRPFAFSGRGFYSLPSGHNASGWAVSTVLSRNARTRALKLLAYAPAILTFASRIYQDQHWTSDCVLGAAIGITAGNWAVNRHDTHRANISLSPGNPTTLTLHF